ncbi:hypothetical protein B4N89_36720 [Embleya scabrispora]|uniref:Uncharacterized protein n=1 Tax=Embleya scabrispora TaxID=159449 RepID=A0A1T3NLQ5_9ACTN|nr:hypothetical protein B4N89_36720 [Embleya scabrispora]
MGTSRLDGAETVRPGRTYADVVSVIPDRYTYRRPRAPDGSPGGASLRRRPSTMADRAPSAPSPANGNDTATRGPHECNV